MPMPELDIYYLSLIGSKWKHKNGFIYEIVDYVFFGDTDTWLVKHVRAPASKNRRGIEFVRSIKNFFEPGRFERVKQ